ncbi:MAG TPA: 3-dehydroquinate synthase [Planctomycetota bacterium]|nr:3-dehydroquinate synthase [Planctomycetota bacterium]
MKYQQKIQVNFNYDVVFTRDLFAPHNHTLAEVLPNIGKPARMAFFVDEGMLKHWPNLLEKITAWCKNHDSVVTLVERPMVVPGGEDVKNEQVFVHRMTHQLQRMQICRHSYVVAIGGGAVLDAIGLAAAVFHRGVRLIRVPTTVLSQDDSAVGVKNSINLDGVKNLIGTFAPPFAVLNDALFLQTLEFRDWAGGLSEAFKVALIKDATLLEELDKLAKKLASRDLDAMERIVQRCAILHLEHIATAGDPFESGSARPLDFGHWSAHKLETMTNFEVRHGEAVAIGIALDLYCAAKLGFITDAERDRVCAIMRRCGLKLWHPALSRQSSATGTLAIVAGLEEFRQHLGGRLTITMPDGLGKKIEIHELSPALVEQGIAWLKATQAQPMTV